MLITKNVKVTVQSDTTRWGGGFSENGLFILLETEGNTDEPAPQKGKEILDLILTKITNYKERNLTTAVDITDWAKKNKFIKTLTLGFLQEGILYLANMGVGEVWMQRSGKAGKILSSGETSLGKVKEEDILIFSSKTFLHSLDRQKQDEIIKIENISEAAESTYSMLVGNTDAVGAAALILKLINQKAVEQPVSDSQVQKTDYKIILKEKLIKFRDAFFENGEESKPKKTLLTIATVLILLLIVSIFLNISHSQSASKQNRLKQTVDLVSHQYDEAANLIDLNPSRARLLLSDGKLSLSGLLKEFPKSSKEYKEINDWLSKIAQKEVEAYKIFKFTAVPLFFDVNLIKNGGSGNKIVLDKKMAAILDSKNKTIYSLSLDTKQAAILAGSEVVKDTQAISVHGKSAYLVNTDGIIQIDIPAKTSQIIVKPDKDWGEISQIVAYGGNLYLLDRKNNAIWKYIAQEEGFSARTNYLNPDVRVSFFQARAMIIDGSVWVLSDAETIFKFTNGRGDTFSFKGVSDTISGITTIFTSEEAKNLYILDKNAQRILVFDKDGEYQSQYQWEELKNADDLVVSEEEKKIFVLSAGKIYAIDIK